MHSQHEHEQCHPHLLLHLGVDLRLRRLLVMQLVVILDYVEQVKVVKLFLLGVRELKTALPSVGLVEELRDQQQGLTKGICKQQGSLCKYLVKELPFVVHDHIQSALR